MVDMCNFLIVFGCASEKTRVVIASLYDWMANWLALPYLLREFGYLRYY